MKKIFKQLMDFGEAMLIICIGIVVSSVIGLFITAPFLIAITSDNYLWLLLFPFTSAISLLLLLKIGE